MENEHTDHPRSRSMEKRIFTICNQRGLHARAAAKFVKLAGLFDAEITVTKDAQTVSGGSIMGLMMLAAGIGTAIEVTARGEDETPALEAIAKLIADKFEEEC